MFKSKTELLKLCIGDKVETTTKAVEAIGRYRSGKIIKFYSVPQSTGSIISFKCDDGTIEVFNELWLQEYIGLKYSANGKLLSDSTVEDFIKEAT